MKVNKTNLCRLLYLFDPDGPPDINVTIYLNEGYNVGILEYKL
jgi:hypothetical protein